MNLKIYSLVAFLTLLITIGVKAQDTQALAVLEATAKKIHANKELHISFEYSITTMENASKEVYKGDFLVKANKYKMSIDETITFCNGKTRWVYLVESNEVNVSDVIKGEDLELEEQFLNDPLSIYDVYKAGFKYRLVGEDNGEGKENYQIDLSPLDINKPFFKVRYVVSKDFDLQTIQYFQKDGTKIFLKITSVNTTEKFKDSDFNFNIDKYPDVEIIDLR